MFRQYVHRIVATVCLLGLFLAEAPPLPVSAATGSVRVTSLTDNRGSYSGSRVPRYARFEATFSLSARYANPFAPYPVNSTAAVRDQVDADGAKAETGGATVLAEITTPSSKVLSTPAFCYSACDSGQAHVWKLRFTPAENGAYSWRLRISDAAGGSTSDSYSFDVAESGRDGFARPAAGTKFFRFDSGKTFIGTGGNNLKKTRDRPTIDHYRDVMTANSMNLQRIWLHPHYTAIEWIANRFGSGLPADKALGRYSLAGAENMDYVVDSGTGLYYVLTQDDMICYANAREADIAWSYNPYKQITTNIDFFTDSQAKAFYKRRLRYNVARWGYSPQIIAWEIMNEVDWPIYNNEWTGDPMNVVRWHEEMGQYIHKVDIYRHAVAANTASPVDRWAAGSWFWSLHKNPSVDISNHHSYYQPEVRKYQECVDAFTTYCGIRPHLLTEWGASAHEATDHAEWVGIHNAGWTGLMYTGHAPLTWWWDMYYDVGYQQFRNLSRFTAGEDYLRDGLALRKFTASNTNVEAFGLASTTKALFWAHDKTSLCSLDGCPASKSGVKITVGTVTPGTYEVEYWNTWTGTVIRKEQVNVASGSLSVTLTDFDRDVAVKAKRLTATTPTPTPTVTRTPTVTPTPGPKNKKVFIPFLITGQ